MTIGPEPITRILRISVRFGIPAGNATRAVQGGKDKDSRGWHRLHGSVHGLFQFDVVAYWHHDSHQVTRGKMRLSSCTHAAWRWASSAAFALVLVLGSVV